MLEIPRLASLHSFLLHCQGAVYERRTRVLLFPFIRICVVDVTIISCKYQLVGKYFT